MNPHQWLGGVEVCRADSRGRMLSAAIAASAPERQGFISPVPALTLQPGLCISIAYLTHLVWLVYTSTRPLVWLVYNLYNIYYTWYKYTTLCVEQCVYIGPRSIKHTPFSFAETSSKPCILSHIDLQFKITPPLFNPGTSNQTVKPLISGCLHT